MTATRSLRTHALHALLLLSSLVGTSLLSSTADAMRLRRCRQGCGKNGMCKAYRRKYFCKRRGRRARREADAPGIYGEDPPPVPPVDDYDEYEANTGEDFYLYLCSGLPYEDYYVQDGDVVPDSDPVSTLLPDMASTSPADFFALPGGAYGDGLPAADEDLAAPAPVQGFTDMAEASITEGGYGYGGVAAVYGNLQPGLVECPTVVYTADLELGDDEEVPGPNGPGTDTTGPVNPTGQPDGRIRHPRRPRGERPTDAPRERRPRRERRGRE